MTPSSEAPIGGSRKGGPKRVLRCGPSSREVVALSDSPHPPGDEKLPESQMGPPPKLAYSVSEQRLNQHGVSKTMPAKARPAKLRLPALKAALDASREFRAWSACFGLSPSDADRIGANVKAAAGDNPFAPRGTS